jgi:hypothetical protein
VHHEAADRVVVRIRQLRVEELVEVVDPRQRLHDESAAVLRLNRRHVFVIVLVVDLADDRLEHVLDRRETRYAAVLVDDDRHVVASLAKLRK